MPPAPTSATVATGARLAPEMMCLPFKITLGNMLWCVEHGADTLVYVSGDWSCRFGYYGRLQAAILRDLGFRFNVIELRRNNLRELGRQLLLLSEGRPARALILSLRALHLGWQKSVTIELAEALSRRFTPLVRDPKRCRLLLGHIYNLTQSISSPHRLRLLRKRLPGWFASLERGTYCEVLRIKLVGESYCTIDPFVNFDIVRRLGEMGVEVHPFLTAHRWLGFHGARLGRTVVKRVKAAAQAYWRYCVGGEDENSIGHMVEAARQGFDGVIHIHPFACMPSTVVQPAMAKVSCDYDLPFLSLSVDEHTAESGFLTRIEAFVSLLRKRRERRRLAVVA
ncbi:MAG: hypothetical protein ABIK43_03840 [candidate division WOR-3 bacterium]